MHRLRARCAIVLAVTLAAAGAGAHPDADPDPAAAYEPLLEVSFGNSQLFLDQPVLTGGEYASEEVVPVTSLVLLVEYFVRRDLTAVLFSSIPLDTKKTLEDGVVREESVAATVALGVGWTPARFELLRQSRAELQLGLLGGTTIGSAYGDRLFPMVASRIRFVSRQGFALYLGGGYAFDKETLALLYGVGYQF